MGFRYLHKYNGVTGLSVVFRYRTSYGSHVFRRSNYGGGTGVNMFSITISSTKTLYALMHKTQEQPVMSYRLFFDYHFRVMYGYSVATNDVNNDSL